MGRQQNRNDAIILFIIMSNARYVRIVGTARNTNQRPTSPAVTTDPVTAESAETTTPVTTSPEVTTTPVATKSDMITNQAAT